MNGLGHNALVQTERALARETWYLNDRPRWRIIRWLFHEPLDRDNAVQIKNEPQPEAQQQPEEDLLAVSLQNARKFIVANWLHIVFALALVAAIAMAVRAYEYRRQSHVLAAWGELGSVPADELQFVAQPDKVEQMRQEALTAVGDVVQHPPEAAAMPWAQLQFGSLQADGGDWTGAARTFADLTTKYPLSEPVATARAALATSLEAQGKYKEAGDIYERLAGEDQPYYLLSAARCRELAGDLDAAKQLYEKARDNAAKDQSLAQSALARLQDLAMGLPLTVPPAVQAAKLVVPAPVAAPVVQPPTPSATPAAPVSQPPVPAAQPDKAAAQPDKAAAQPAKPAGENR